ncbi:MAG: recombination protein NinG [Saprospiraceae bacterium]|nr:recombination protein NinG [Saprospiraceae bacterium]
MNKYTKNSTIETGQLLRCEKCGRSSRWIPYNSTIKPKLCRLCYNKSLLERSNLAARKWKSKQKPGKYTIRNKNGRKVLKSPHKRFYRSTAWKWFSRYILITNNVDRDSVTIRCSTCGKLMLINSKECHVGHYIRVFDGNSTNYSTAFVEANTAPQCLRCNKYMGGRQDEMAKWITEKYDLKTLQELWELKKLPLKLDAAYLKEVADRYKEKYHNYLREHNIEDPWKKK